MNKQVVIVTGAKGGLGTSVTKKFLNAGDTVVGASRSIQSSDFPSKDFVAIPTDFSDPVSVRALTDATIAQFGRIDALVHVVGGFAGGTPVHETTLETWKQMMEQNLNAAFHVMHEVIPRMRHAGSGRIVLVGSKTADQPHPNLSAYVVSKSALVVLMKTVAMENAASGVRVNAVLPGTMDTPANRAAMPKADRSKWVQPSEVADVIYWLTTEAASQVNGAAIPVSGADM